jgi:hypothetical protein
MFSAFGDLAVCGGLVVLDGRCRLVLLPTVVGGIVLLR